MRFHCYFHAHYVIFNGNKAPGTKCIHSIVTEYLLNKPIIGSRELFMNTSRPGNSVWNLTGFGIGLISICLCEGMAASRAARLNDF